MRFHVLCLPHTELNDSDLACAYTQKIVKFVKMMTMRGHEVITYGGAQAPAHVTEHVHIIDIPEHDSRLLYEVDWINDFTEYNWKAIPAIRERADDHDFLCVTSGNSHDPVINAIPELMAVETGIGYYGTTCKFRVFESYAWMHTVYADQKDTNGHWYDAVIPNYFDVDDFPDPPCDSPHGYLAWMGRFVERKGPHIALQIARAVGRPLRMAGQGVLSRLPGQIVGAELTLEGGGFEHIGPVGKKERAHLLRHADAFLMPTTYVEPFGGVAVEALMSGTPVISTDWGAFPEFVIPHWNGTRFRTLKEAVKGVEEATYLDRKWIQAAARKRFSLEAVGEQYETYFARLQDLWGEGWSTL